MHVLIYISELHDPAVLLQCTRRCEGPGRRQSWPLPGSEPRGGGEPIY